jgi:glycosyltransferase involved in cell wall biosynthesis
MPEYEATVRRLGEQLLGPRLRILGDRADVADLMRASDVVVLASASEGLPLSILEAQACARPVVAYPAGGVADLIEDGRSGLLARQGDTAHLAAQLARVLGDPALGRQLGAAAQAQVSTLDSQADAHVAVLRALVPA